VFAYSGGLPLISETLKGLQAVLHTVGSVTTWAVLGYIPRKFATLRIDGKQYKALRTQFHIQEGAPTALSEM
jgi:hypothetical protein